MTRTVSPLSAGLRSRCPNCGEGPVFKTYLGIAPRCTSCGADFSKSDSGDGPGFFVMLLVGLIVTPPLLVVQVIFDPPAWLQLLIWTPVVVLLTVWLLRPFKAVLFALQWKHKAEEARWQDQDGGPS